MEIAHANFSGSCTLVTTVLPVFMTNFSRLMTLSIPWENLNIGRPRSVIKKLWFVRVYGTCDKQEELLFLKIYEISLKVPKNRKILYANFFWLHFAMYKNKQTNKNNGFNQNSTEAAIEGVLLNNACNFIKKRLHHRCFF